MIDMTANWNPQGTSGTIADDRRQNKMDTYPGQALTASIQANWVSKVNYFSQWTLEGFPQPWSNEVNNMSEVSKSLEQYPWNTLHIRDPGMTSSGRPASPGCWCSWAAGSGPPPFLPIWLRYRKKTKQEKKERKKVWERDNERKRDRDNERKKEKREVTNKHLENMVSSTFPCSFVHTTISSPQVYTSFSTR